MNASRKRETNSRIIRTIKVAPTTRAIRAALAVSATMLALAGSGAALAGTCAVTGLSEVTCNGVFTDDVTNTVPVINLVPDLTLVVGTDGTTTVDPAAGVTGITSTWGGDATVINYAEINTSGADGIYMDSDDSATLSNYGSVYTYANTGGDIGVSVGGIDGVTVVNGGDVTAANNNNYNAVGIYTNSIDGYTTVDNLAGGNVSASTYSGNAYGILVGISDQGAYVTNDGQVSASSFTGAATGVAVFTTYGDAAVANGGSIEVYSLSGYTTGVDAFSVFYDATVNNAGTIDVGGQGYAEGIEVFSGFGTASVDNSGTLTVTSYGNGAVGVDAYGKYADIDNSGDITVSGYSSAVGIQADGIYGTTISNSGSLNVTSTGFGAEAGGISVQGNGYINIYNSGDITVTSTGDGGGAPLLPYSEGADAVGMSAISEYSEGGNGLATLLYGPNDVNEVNTGNVVVSAAGNGVGMYAGTLGAGNVYLDNQGTVTVDAGGYAGGIVGYSNAGTVEVQNSGSVDVYAYFGGAYGIYVRTSSYAGAVTIDSSGSIDAYSYDDLSIGISTQTTGSYADVSIDNSGSIDTYSYNYHAVGIRVSTAGYDADVSVTSSGSIYAASDYGQVVGILAVTGGSYSDVYVGLTDTSVVDVYSYTVNFPIIGVFAVTIGYDSALTLDNAGDIYVGSAYTDAFGAQLVTAGQYSEITVDNSGNIDAYAPDGSALGITAQTVGGYADVSVSNSGSITAYGYYSAIGVQALAVGAGSDVYVGNSGYIGAYSRDGSAHGVEAMATNYDGDVTVDNSGDIYAGSYFDEAVGLVARTDFDYGDISVDSSGSVTAYSYFSTAVGMRVTSSGYYSEINIDNSGSISATSVYYDAWGIASANSSDGGDINIDSSGSITVSAYYEAYGIQVSNFSDYDGNTTVNNSGSITVSSSDDDAWGIYAYTYEGDTNVDNSGSISVDSVAYATGVYATSSYGDVNIVNSGPVDVTAAFIGIGLQALAPYGYANVTNTETGSVTVEAGFIGGGIVADSKYGSYVLNDGSVLVDTASDYNSVQSFGIYAITDGGNYSKYNTYSDVVNNGSVTVYASSPDYVAQAFGISAFANDNIYNYGYADIVNNGSVVASASGAVGIAIGLNAVADYASIEQYGSVYAYAYGGLTAIATGARASADISASFYGAAGSSTDAYATSYYNVLAEGAAAFSNAYVDFYNAGDISATAVSSGAYYFATAIGANVRGDYLTFYNAGNIDASASGYEGAAIGAYLASDYGFTAYNSGSITATGAGAYVTAIGVEARSGGDIALFNYGDIAASADYYAFGVDLITNGSVYIYNAGTIEASDAAYNVAIYTPGYSVDTIRNYGTINGAIWSGYGDDYLYNYGEWNPGQTPTYFGSGDDTIVNVGTINMDDSVIDLGTYSVYGNFFYNYGTVAVNGVYNVINMGGPQALVPSLNPNPFYNGGVIDFQDGAPDDMLTIIGDFAGDGDINVDVSGLDGVSDILYIDGSVVSGTAGVINVDLLDLPESIATLVPIVYVTGDSVDGNFVLGDVNWDEDNSFVTLDFDIVSDIDASNATNDVFSLGIEVTGLSDPGTLAASLGSSVQSLMNSQVGTWRQRMGVIDSFNKGGVALWARVFTDKGSFTPEHVAGNFGQGGNFDFDQKNSGVEGGIDFAVTDEFSIGLLVSKSQADIHLDDPGTGNADLDADTWGVYGTWISPNGFYLDASYRWMNFDVDLSSVAGGMETSGDAEAFNVEMGYAWTLEGGLKIEPQLQYTRTSVNNFDVLTTTTGMTFEEDGGDSSRGRLGVSIRKGFGEADNGWLWTPYATLSAVREFNGKSGYAINNTFFGETSVEGTSALLELGFTARHQNWAIYGGLNWQDGGAVNSFFGGQLGVRYTFGHAEPAPMPVAPPPAKTCADLDDDGDGVNNCDDKCLGSAAGEAVGADGCPVPPEPVMEPKPFRG